MDAVRRANAAPLPVMLLLELVPGVAPSGASVKAAKKQMELHCADACNQQAQMIESSCVVRSHRHIIPLHDKSTRGVDDTQ